MNTRAIEGGRRMKQFGKILKFELVGYLKNKIFVGITLFFVIATVLGMNIPKLLAEIDVDEVTENEIKTMLVHSPDGELMISVCELFTEAFPDYEVSASEQGEEHIKAQITSGEADCAFIVNSADSYVYYVNNLSMYDMNTATADAVLGEICKLNAMVESGLTPEQAGEVLSVRVEGTTETLGKNQMQNFLYTYIMIFALYAVILLYGQMVATNVATEKSSRAMEVLITSADPTSMMFGKVLASCIAGFSQLVLIFGSAILSYNFSKDDIENSVIASIFDIPVELFAYMIVFFILGFLIYAFMFGAVGSTASKLEDINTSVMPITFIFIAALMVVVFSMTSGTVDNTLMVICSYFPLTSSIAMFTRIAMSTVAWYEIAISIIILLASTVGIGILSAKIYRIGVLLYGNPPKIGNLIKTALTKK